MVATIHMVPFSAFTVDMKNPKAQRKESVEIKKAWIADSEYVGNLPTA